MSERPIVAELRAVEAALSPLAPSRELDSRIDALLAGRARSSAPRRLVFAGLGACAALAAVALWLGPAEPAVVAAAPGAAPTLPAAPTHAAPLPAMPPPTKPHATPQPSAAPPSSGEPLAAPAALALAERAAVAPAPEAAPLLERARQPLVSPVERTVTSARAERRDVTGARPPPTVLLTREAADADAALEAALAAVRADRRRGDVRGALARIDLLLSSGVSARVAVALRIERARLHERLGEHGAACASLLGLDGDDAHDARLRLSCP